VRIGGCAATIQQYLRAGMIDGLHLVIVPILLGSGERSFEDLEPNKDVFGTIEFVSSPAVVPARLMREG
jgi:dihydrofolate reductase